MIELTTPSDHMREILDRMRAVMGREGEVSPDPGGNPSDDDGPATAQETLGDLQQSELAADIDMLDIDQQHELVALMWVGRGDFSASEWAEAMALAAERHDGPTARYLLSHPRVADQIASGLEDLGHDHVLQDGIY
ncbi:DUF3775 domain-containing protein [Actibacterium sp. 188UL27-1]|uniref:DUF3775 domain-containing protein n=1 Tax=Actibacterium sp. 188UL27-1 TaxID=2786961 RepID=UPI001957A20B|nr:DUF3775 domain-containing protein [Actibacterium sp. 188UL27-1]MBM7066456.1 DUF3775 domain-containing protein [Actibacterium sp. 188UL27-1]